MQKLKRTCAVLTVVLLVLQIANQLGALQEPARVLYAVLGFGSSATEARPGLPENDSDNRQLLPQIPQVDPAPAAPTAPDLRQECIATYLSQQESGDAATK